MMPKGVNPLTKLLVCLIIITPSLDTEEGVLLPLRKSPSASSLIMQIYT